VLLDLRHIHNRDMRLRIKEYRVFQRFLIPTLLSLTVVALEQSPCSGLYGKVSRCWGVVIPKLSGATRPEAHT
jgi:hypothetical protein